MGTERRRLAYKDYVWGRRDPIKYLKTYFIGRLRVDLDVFFGHMSSQITLVRHLDCIHCGILADSL